MAVEERKKDKEIGIKVRFADSCYYGAKLGRITHIPCLVK